MAKCRFGTSTSQGVSEMSACRQQSLKQEMPLWQLNRIFDSGVRIFGTPGLSKGSFGS